MRTTQGPRRVDVIYRRIDDAFLDPLCFRPDSMLGVPGLMNVYRAGGVTIASAPGAGEADDKAIYTYVPDMIRFYLGETADPEQRSHMAMREGGRMRLRSRTSRRNSVVKGGVHGSGGYGMLVGPKSTERADRAFADKIREDPSNYIAQPTLALSTCPPFVDEGVAPRHVDLRPLLPCRGAHRTGAPGGGLTRGGAARRLARG